MKRTVWKGFKEALNNVVHGGLAESSVSLETGTRIKAVAKGGGRYQMNFTLRGDDVPSAREERI